MSTFGSRLERGHTLSVPHSPIGITGAFGHRGQPGRAPAALQLGVEERRATRDRALRHDRHDLAAGEGVGGGLQRLVGAGAAVDPDAAHRGGQLADDGASNTSFLPRKRTVRPLRAIASDIAAESK